MDTLHSVLFYALATVTVGGALATALAPARLRALSMALVAIGLASLYTILSAGFAGVIALLAYLGVAVLVHGHWRWEAATPAVVDEPRGILQQLAGPLAGIAFLVLAYLAWRTGFHSGYRFNGEFNATALGRLLVNRDALAMEALGLALFAAAAGAGLATRVRR